MSQVNDVEEFETHFSYSVNFPENRAVYVIMWEKIVEMDRPQMTVWRMRIACWVT